MSNRRKDQIFNGNDLLIRMMHPETSSLLSRVYFWKKILHLPSEHAAVSRHAAAKRKYRNWIRQTVNNKNMKNSIFRKSEFPCYFGSLAAQRRLQRKPIAMHAVEFRPHSYAHAFRLWVTFDVSHWTSSAPPRRRRFSFRARNPNAFRRSAFIVACARARCVSFQPITDCTKLSSILLSLSTRKRQGGGNKEKEREMASDKTVICSCRGGDRGSSNKMVRYIHSDTRRASILPRYSWLSRSSSSRNFYPFLRISWRPAFDRVVRAFYFRHTHIFLVSACREMLLGRE